jgi:endonuclease-8
VHRIVGATCTHVRSQGKNMLISFDNGLALRGHLRMYGTWHLYKPGEPWQKPEREARLVLETDEAVIVNFSAPVIELLEERALNHHQPIAALGPDLIDDAFGSTSPSPTSATSARTHHGDALMDKGHGRRGNIWKHETFHCGVNPLAPRPRARRRHPPQPHPQSPGALRASVRKPNASGIQRRPRMWVYKRTNMPCFRCHTRIRSAPQGVDIRRTSYCPTCQPPRPNQSIQPPTRSHR